MHTPRREERRTCRPGASEIERRLLGRIAGSVNRSHVRPPARFCDRNGTAAALFVGALRQIHTIGKIRTSRLTGPNRSCKSQALIITHASSPIGRNCRRARLKIEFRKECWFDSGMGHHNYLIVLVSLAPFFFWRLIVLAPFAKPSSYSDLFSVYSAGIFLGSRRDQ